MERYKNYAGIRIIIIEASVNDFDLPDEIEGSFMHLKYKLSSYFWCKENLINIAISKLPSDWKYVSWIDADITKMGIGILVLLGRVTDKQLKVKAI